MTFNVVCDENERISIQSRWTHSRPGPAAIVGLYADIYSGQVLSDFRMGGIGQPFDPQPPEQSLTVMLGSDSHERWGHQCPRCGGYFRSAHHPAIFPLTCAYCGLKQPAHVFLTPAQRNYVAHIAGEVSTCIYELKANEEREIVIDMDRVSDEGSGATKPPFYYSDQAQQTEFHCVKCGNYNDVRGRFAYCSSCGWKNNRADIQMKFEEIRGRLNDAGAVAANALRDAVSEFDACCRDFAAQVRKRMPMKPARKAALEGAFHDIHGSVIRTMKEAADIDLAKGVSEGDLKFVKQMIHRRHVYEHLGGVADEVYRTESGDTETKVGELLREDKGNVHRFIGLLSRMIDNLEAEFHEIFPPTEWPVKYFLDGQERRKRAGF